MEEASAVDGPAWRADVLRRVMHVFAEAGARKEDDALNPLTAYARSKAAAERDLEAIADGGGMVVTVLRFATACGFSPRLRLDPRTRSPPCGSRRRSCPGGRPA